MKALAACWPLLLAGCAMAPVDMNPRAAVSNHPEASVFDRIDNAEAALDAALMRAKAEDKRVLMVLGANWCHDSRAFAGWMETDRFAALLERAYVPLYLDAGSPQSGQGRHLDLAARYGVSGIEGTPTVIVLTSEGSVVNADSAKSWRNAASRSEDAIYAELERLGTP